MKQCSIKEVVA